MVWNWVVFMVGPSSAALWNSVTNVLRASSKSEYWDSSRTQTVILISDQWSITRNKTALMALFKDHIINLPAEHSHYWLLWNLLETSNFLRREIHHWLITCIYDLHQCVNRRTSTTVCFLLPQFGSRNSPQLESQGFLPEFNIDNLSWKYLNTQKLKTPKNPTGRQRRGKQSRRLTLLLLTGTINRSELFQLDWVLLQVPECSSTMMYSIV